MTTADPGALDASRAGRAPARTCALAWRRRTLPLKETRRVSISLAVVRRHFKKAASRSARPAQLETKGDERCE
jgi:hypothetical protein